MALGDVVLEAFCETRATQVGLLLGGVEVSAPGYARQPAAWKVGRGRAAAHVEFFFSQPAKFDAVGLYVDGRLADVDPLGGPVQLLPGMGFAHDVNVEIGARK